MIRGFIKELLQYTPSQVVPALVGLLAIPIVTRLFPPGDYGYYSLVIATVNILITVAVGWLSMSIIRFYPAYERGGEVGEFQGSVVRILLISVACGSALFLGVLYAIKPYLSSQLWKLMMIGVLLFFLLAIFQVIQHFLRSKHRVNWYSGFQVWYKVASFGIGIALIVGLNFGIDGLLWGCVVSTAIAFPLLWKTALGGEGVLETKGIMTGLPREMAKYGFPLVAGNLAAWILSVSDRYILELFKGPQEVGIYSAVYAISEASVLLAASLFTYSSAPISIDIWERDGVEKAQEFINKLTRYYIIFCLPVAVGLAALAKPAVALLVASEYREGYRIVAFVVFGGFLLGLQQRYQSGLIFHKKTPHIMLATVASALLNVGLNFWLVPIYGYMAAAFTTLVSYAFLLIGMIVFSRKHFTFEFPYKSCGRAVLACLVMGAAAYWVGEYATSSNVVNLFSGIIVGILVYFAMLGILGEFRAEEIEALKSALRKITGRSSE
ncbi:MAG: flippase [Actinomycetota bacterium]|nr:flippase [Actinomycetota bacterium]